MSPTPSPSNSSSTSNSPAPDTSLSLGMAPDGQPLVLDLGTGEIRASGTPDPWLQLLSARDLDAARVASVFRSAGYQAMRDTEGDVAVHDGRRLCAVLVHPDQLVIRMLMLFDFKGDVPARVRQGCIGHLNTRMHLGRFFVTADGRLAVVHELTTAAGLSAAQLLATYRLYGEYARESIDECKVGRLLE